MIEYVEGKGWVNTAGGREYAIGGATDQALKDSFNEKRAVLEQQYNRPDLYKDTTLDDIKAMVDGDNWWRSRLPRYAEGIRTGDDGVYRFQFDVSSSKTPFAHELTNRYNALINQGYTDSEIMGAIYGTSSAGNNIGGNNPLSNATGGTGSSWIDVLNRKGKNIESWDRSLGMFTGMSDKLDWSGLDMNGVTTKFDALPDGLFSGVDRADVLQRLMKSLGLG